MVSRVPNAGNQPKAGRPRHPSPVARHPYVILTGNPNCGKTTLFNALTGLRAKVGNYAGVTVERKEGRLLGAPAETDIRVLDLPGTYSLSPNSLDEQISRDVLLNRLPELPPPGLIVVIVDASNLQRNLYYATQVVELGHPTLIALNMVDVAEANGQRIDEAKLGRSRSACPVAADIVGQHAARALPELRRQDHLRPFRSRAAKLEPKLFCQLPGLFRIEATGLADLLAATFQERRLQATAEALLILSNEKALASSKEHYPQKIQDAVAAARKRLEAHGIDWRGAPIEWRYARIAEIQQAVTSELAPPGETFSDKLDRVLTHKIWGTLIFIGIMTLMFQSIFTFANIPMDALQAIVDWAGRRDRQTDSARRFEFIAGEWRGCGRRRGDSFSAANPAAVPVHRLFGRHRLHGARGVFDGPADEQGRAARQKFHSHAEFVRLRDSRHHGHAHD